MGRKLVGFLEKHRLKTRANHFSLSPRNDLLRHFELLGLKSQSRIKSVGGSEGNIQIRMYADAKRKRSIQFTFSSTVCPLSGCFHLDVASQRDHWRHLHFVAATTHQNKCRCMVYTSFTSNAKRKHTHRTHTRQRCTRFATN